MDGKRGRYEGYRGKKAVVRFAPGLRLGAGSRTGQRFGAYRRSPRFRRGLDKSYIL